MNTTDIWLAAFLYQKDSSKLVGCSRDTKKVYYKFDYTKEEWVDLKLEFIKSHATSLKYTIEQLKDLAFQ